jgi:hypothetical protein
MATALVRGLRARGVDLVTTADAGQIGSSDEEQLAFAAAHGLVLYTFNVGDFCRLHLAYLETGRSHAGIVVVPRQRYDVGQQIRAICRLTTDRTASEMQNALVFLRV